MCVRACVYVFAAVCVCVCGCVSSCELCVFVCVFLNGQLKGKVTKIKSNQIEFIPLNVYLSRVLIMEIRTHFAVRNQARHEATSFRE